MKSINSKDKLCPQEFKFANGNLISVPKQIADAFNDYFVNIGDTLPLNANPIVDYEQYVPVKPNCTLKCQSVSVDNVRIWWSCDSCYYTCISKIFRAHTNKY